MLLIIAIEGLHRFHAPEALHARGNYGVLSAPQIDGALLAYSHHVTLLKFIFQGLSLKKDRGTSSSPDTLDSPLDLKDPKSPSAGSTCSTSSNSQVGLIKRNDEYLLLNRSQACEQGSFLPILGY